MYMVKDDGTIMYEMVTIVDTNDADCETRITEISQKDLDRFRPLIAAIAAFKPYEGEWDVGHTTTHRHNWPHGECLREDMGEKPVEEIYSDFDAELLEDFEAGYLPLGNEWGFHTIVKIEIYPKPVKEVLLERKY